MTPGRLEVLTEARNLIDKKGWTQYAGARDIRGDRVDAYDEHATCFCMVGAVCRAAKGDPLIMDELLAALYMAKPTHSVGVIRWNDTPGRTKEEVLAVFDKAIAEG